MNRLNEVQLLLDYKAAVNQAMANGRTPLFIATTMGYLGVVQLLLDREAAVSQATAANGVTR